MVYHSNSHPQLFKSGNWYAIRNARLRAENRVTHVLGEPTEAFAVALPLNDGNHEEFDGADVIEGDLALGCHVLSVFRWGDGYTRKVHTFPVVW